MPYAFTYMRKIQKMKTHAHRIDWGPPEGAKWAKGVRGYSVGDHRLYRPAQSGRPAMRCSGLKVGKNRP